MTTVKQTFDALVQEIDTAVTARGFFSVCDRAAALGLLGGKIDLKCAVHYQFEAVDSTGTVLDLQAYSYNPSGPTQVRPCVTRFAVRATENGQVTLQYENEYEGLVKP